MKTKISRCQSNRPVKGKPCKNPLEDSQAWMHGKNICRECSASVKWDTWWKDGNSERQSPGALKKKKYKVTDAMEEKTSSRAISIQTGGCKR